MKIKPKKKERKKSFGISFILFLIFNIVFPVRPRIQPMGDCKKNLDKSLVENIKT